MTLMGFEKKVENSNRGLLDALCNVTSDQVLSERIQSIKVEDANKSDLNPKRLTSYMEDEQRKERLALEKQVRRRDRQNADELIVPILSLDIVDHYFGKSPSELAETLPKVPDTFPDSMSYLESWIPLFLYETYN